MAELTINTGERILALGEGSHHCGWGAGYIHITSLENFEVIRVLWTTNKDYHSSLACLPAICIEYDLAQPCHSFVNIDGFIWFEAYKSARTMHKVKVPVEQEQILKFIKKKINQAHDLKELGNWISRTIKKLRKCQN